MPKSAYNGDEPQNHVGHKAVILKTKPPKSGGSCISNRVYFFGGSAAARVEFFTLPATLWALPWVLSNLSSASIYLSPVILTPTLTVPLAFSAQPAGFTAIFFCLKSEEGGLPGRKGLDLPISHMRRSKPQSGSPGRAPYDADAIIDSMEPIVEV